MRSAESERSAKFWTCSLIPSAAEGARHDVDEGNLTPEREPLMQTVTLHPCGTQRDRRRFRPDSETPRQLALASLAGSRHQLADARENLKAGRRRVVQLEDAVANWEAVAAQLPDSSRN